MKRPFLSFVSKHSFCLLTAFVLTAASSQAQLQWSSYDTSGNLVSANVATGGDQASASSVTFTIPANTQLSFVTRNFTPFSLAGANARKLVTFDVLVSAGFGGVAQRTMGWGLYNSAGTAGFTDDVGYFGLWNGGGPYIETYDHPAGAADLLSGTKLGQGTAASGTPSDGVTYTNQIQLVMNASANGIALGTSSSTLANAGLAMNGTGVTHRVYTNPVNPLLGGAALFDEFVLMFNNTTANPVTVTLSAITLGNTLTWDASGANPGAPTDGSGNWSTTNANWSSVAADSVWSPAYSAVIGAANGAAGIITNANTAGLVVSNITFNAAGSGSYNIVGSPLILTGTPTITVANGVIATNSALLGGTGFMKAGNGTLVLASTAAATNVGLTTVNAGTLFLSTGSSLNDSVTVNSGATLLVTGSSPINTAGTLTINGGAVTNLGIGGTPTETHNVVVFDNNGVLAYGPTGSGQVNLTNCDFRSGLQAFPKFAAAQSTNFSVKSTPGTMAVQSRPNNTGLQGLVLTVAGGTMILDYPNPAPNGDSTQGGAKLLPAGPLTLGGGTLFGRFNAAASRTETVLSARILPGATTFQITNNAANGSGAYSIVQNALIRSVGGTVDYSIGGTSTGGKTITTTTANVNGILGGYATFGGANWAVGTSIAGYSAYTVSTDPATWVAANNVSLSANPTANVPDLTTINTLRLGGATVTLNGSLTLTTGGLLATGTVANAISGGTLVGGSGADLIVHQYGPADLTISSTLADNSSATALTKSGPGKLILTGTDNLTGANYLNGGTVEVGSLAELAAGPIVLNNGTLHYTGSDTTSSRAITLNGVGGTLDIAGGATVTQAAAINGSGGFNSPITIGLNLGDWGGLTKNGNGTLVLATNNVYNGPTVVNSGTLLIDATNSLTGTSGLTNYLGGGTFTVFAGGTLGGTGLVSGPVDIKLGGTLSPGNTVGTLTLASSLTVESGSTNVFDLGGVSSDLLVVGGALAVQSNSTIVLHISGSLAVGTYPLIQYSGSKTGSFVRVPVIVGGSLNGSYAIDDSVPGQVNLIVSPQVVITSQPANTIVSVGQDATFNVSATGTAPLAYQWYQYSDANGDAPVLQTDATNSSFTVSNAQTASSGFYGVVVTNNYNAVTSQIATLIVGNVIPILAGPNNQNVIAGNNVTFSTTVVLANPQPAFQWQTNGVNVDGATDNSLTLSNVPFGFDGMIVSVIATNLAGSVTNTATLAVVVKPAITPQPSNLTVNVGDTAQLISGATGVPTPALQWYKNNVPIPLATGGTLTIANAQGSDIALYKLIATNVAGSVTSSVVKLTVNSTALASATLAPANGATAVCYDTPLYITFNNPISIVNSGKLRIFNATNSTTPVDVIDMSSNAVVVSGGINLTNNIQAHTLFSGDSQALTYFPVIISGTTAAIYPHLDVLTSNQTYYVAMDNGVVVDSTGAYFAGISDTNAWRFTTKIGGPVNPTNIVVAADGSGDFVTVQGAVDSVAPGNNTYTVVNVRNGKYVEIVDISGKNNLTFRGQTRTGAVIGYANNNNLNGTTASRMSFKVNSADIRLENLTITNGTPQGGSQAEALLIYNNGVRCIVNNCDISSRQDTILVNATTSQGYFSNCKVIGNFDYIWGSGVGFFTNCVFHTITNNLSGSYNLTAARSLTSSSYSTNTPWGNPNGTTYSGDGFSFVNCTFEADSGVTGITLAGSNGTAGGVDSWVNSRFDTNAYANPTVALSNTYVFWQHSNTDLTGTVSVSFTNLQTIGVTNNDPRLIAATTAIIWLYGWGPSLAPNIVSQPVGQTVGAGQSASFTVGATGIPDPSYQWLFNGAPISGATAATYNITSAVRTNGGSYSVAVSNGSGSVTSGVAVLTYSGNVPPVAADAAYTRNVAVSQLNIKISDLLTNVVDADGDAITLVSTGVSTNGIALVVNGNYLVYSNNNAVADQFTYNVTDGFGGNSSAVVTVNVDGQPLFGVGSPVISTSGGQPVINFAGIPNYSYSVLRSTSVDFSSFDIVLTTNVPVGGVFQFTDANPPQPTAFYRLQYNP